MEKATYSAQVHVYINLHMIINTIIYYIANLKNIESATDIALLRGCFWVKIVHTVIMKKTKHFYIKIYR